MTNKWSTQETIKFIEKYASYPCLWDPNHGMYKNRRSRAIALERLAASMCFQNFDAGSAKIKIHNLRSTYTAEISKIKKSIKSGAAMEEIYTPKILWFPIADSFLRKATSSRDLSCNMDSGFETLMSSEVKAEEPFLHEMLKMEEPFAHEDHISLAMDTHFRTTTSSSNPISQITATSTSTLSSSTSTSTTAIATSTVSATTAPESPHELFTTSLQVSETPLSVSKTCSDPTGQDCSSRKKRRSGECSSPDFSSDISIVSVQTSSPSKSVEDMEECDIFCRSIAVQMKTLPPKDVIEIQWEIQNLLTQRRLRVLQGTSAGVS